MTIIGIRAEVEGEVGANTVRLLKNNHHSDTIFSVQQQKQHQHHHNNTRGKNERTYQTLVLDVCSRKLVSAVCASITNLIKEEEGEQKKAGDEEEEKEAIESSTRLHLLLLTELNFLLDTVSSFVSSVERDKANEVLELLRHKLLGLEAGGRGNVLLSNEDKENEEQERIAKLDSLGFAFRLCLSRTE